MYKPVFQRLKFWSKQHDRLLQDLVIGPDGPGTILHDFEATLTYIQEREFPVTGMHQLPRRTLPEINARLAHPLEIGLKKPLQMSYPNIHGLYLLVRASGLTLVEGTSKKPFLVVDEAVHDQWLDLNPTERYATLLEGPLWGSRGHQRARVVPSALCLPSRRR